MADGLTLLLGAATIASATMWHGEVKARRFWQERATAWRDQSQAWRDAAEQMRSVDAPTALLCGACGLSVPTTDGFTIAEHNCCQPELFSSSGVAQREM